MSGVRAARSHFSNLTCQTAHCRHSGRRCVPGAAHHASGALPTRGPPKIQNPVTAPDQRRIISCCAASGAHQESKDRTSAIARIVCRGPGQARRLVCRCVTCRKKEPRARGTPGVSIDPRASTPRDIEACRVVCSAASPPNPKASRARRLRFAPHRPRWTYLSGQHPSPVRASFHPIHRWLAQTIVRHV